MVDLEKMRQNWMPSGGPIKDDIYECPHCAIEALRREVEEQRSALSHRWECQQTLERTVENLRQDVQELRRENERLRAERDTLQQNWQRCVEHAARVEEERDFLRKEFAYKQAELREVCEERDRLREALEKMEAMPDTAMPKARRIAHEALAATTDSQVNPEKRDDT